MKFIITGSGGCVCTPKPLCQCVVCVEARAKGYPYARCGCSLYLEDAALLVDTPEDIAAALNNADIRAVDAVLYSHWDPDHTLGMRIMEQLRLEWLDYFEDIPPVNPIAVYADAGVLRDLDGIRSKYGPLLDYYEHMGLIKKQAVNRSIEIGGVRVSFIPVFKEKAVTVFVFEEGGKKLVYAPCDCKPFPADESLARADVLVIGNTFIGDVLKNGRAISQKHPMRKELFSLKEALDVKERLGIGRVVITHIEEDWGKSYDDYTVLEKQYTDVQFAYDGLVINL